MAATLESHRDYDVPALLTRGVFYTLLILAAVTAALLLLPDADQRTQFSDTFSAAVDALSAALLFMGSWASARRSRRLSRASGLLAFAVLLYTAGDATWAYLEVYVNQPP